MVKKKKKIRFKSDASGYVFSTNPDFVPPVVNEDEEAVDAKGATLYLWLEKNGRGGKTVTIVRGFQGNDLELKFLGSQMKSAMSTGGSVKEGEIILQGDVHDKLGKWLNKEGYSFKKAGG